MRKRFTTSKAAGERGGDRYIPAAADHHGYEVGRAVVRYWRGDYRHETTTIDTSVVLFSLPRIETDGKRQRPTKAQETDELSQTDEKGTVTADRS